MLLSLNSQISCPVVPLQCQGAPAPLPGSSSCSLPGCSSCSLPGCSSCSPWCCPCSPPSQPYPATPPLLWAGPHGTHSSKTTQRKRWFPRWRESLPDGIDDGSNCQIFQHLAQSLIFQHLTHSLILQAPTHSRIFLTSNTNKTKYSVPISWILILIFEVILMFGNISVLVIFQFWWYITCCDISFFILYNLSLHDISVLMTFWLTLNFSFGHFSFGDISVLMWTPLFGPVFLDL